MGHLSEYRPLPRALQEWVALGKAAQTCHIGEGLCSALFEALTLLLHLGGQTGQHYFVKYPTLNRDYSDVQP